MLPSSNFSVLPWQPKQYFQGGSNDSTSGAAANAVSTISGAIRYLICGDGHNENIFDLAEQVYAGLAASVAALFIIGGIFLTKDKTAGAPLVLLSSDCFKSMNFGMSSQCVPYWYKRP